MFNNNSRNYYYFLSEEQKNDNRFYQKFEKLSPFDFLSEKQKKTANPYLPNSLVDLQGSVHHSLRNVDLRHPNPNAKFILYTCLP